MVITTTNRAFTTTLNGVSVDVFTPAQATNYLHQQTGINDPAGARDVAAALGYLPLALAEAAWLITTRDKTYPQYLQYLDELARQPLASALRATGHYPHSAAEVILLTIDQTEVTDTTDTTRKVLDTLALLSPTGIPHRLLTSLIDAPHNQTDDALGTLAQASLITYTITHEILMHRLVQRTLRDRATHQGTLLPLTNRIACALDHYTVSLDDAWAHRTEAAQLIDQVTALTDHLYAARPADSEIPESLLELRLWALKHLITVADLTRGITLGSQLTADAEAMLGEDHWITDHAIDQLATAHRSAGHHTQSIPLFERALAISTRRLGPDHPDTLTSRNNLANAYNHAGRTTEAITLHEQTLTDSQRILGPDHPDTLNSRNNLADAYLDAGRTTEAITLHEQTLTDSERILGPDHPDTLTSRNNLATAYQDVKRYAEAITLYEQALAGLERILGPDHPTTLGSLNNLAIARRDAAESRNFGSRRRWGQSRKPVGPAPDDHPEGSKHPGQ